MRKCPRCSHEVADDSQMCRACGCRFNGDELEFAEQHQIPHEEPEDETVPVKNSPQAPEEVADETQDTDGPGPAWACPKCGETIEPGFDICWNCGTSRAGIEDPEFAVVDDVDERDAGSDLHPQSRESSAPCPHCGSRRVIPDAIVADRDGHSFSKIQVVVFSKPDALLFRGSLYGEIRADICGDCGRMALRLENPTEMYEHYLRSLS